MLLSDFLAPIGDIRASVRRLAGNGATGALIQLLDPVELTFPYDGRTIFRSMSGSFRFESFQAGGIRVAYRNRMRERMEAVRELADELGWRSRIHMTDSDVRTALHWLCRQPGTGG